MASQNLYQHYRPEETPFIDGVFDWVRQVDSQYTPYLTTFLTPREAMILEQITSRYDFIQLQLEGGYPGAERKRGLIYPNYYQIQAGDHDLSLVAIHYPAKFANLSHGQILGALTGVGVDRQYIGDIITDGQDWQCFLDSKLVDYFASQVKQVGKIRVSLEEIPRSAVLACQEEWESLDLVASSLRLDTLISKVYNFSRQRAKDAIARDFVKINFVPVQRPDTLVAVYDIVSVRKKGRFKVESIEGKTRKDNYRLRVHVLVT